MLLCSHSHKDIPPKSQQNISTATVQAAMRLSMSYLKTRMGPLVKKG